MSLDRITTYSKEINMEEALCAIEAVNRDSEPR